MKTSIITAVFLFTATLLLANSRTGYYPMSSADWLVLNDEAYVNDIPFDTWKVSNLAYPPDLVLTEEGYVNDIPFNTAEIAREALLNKVIKQKDESSVNDIPFNTKKIYDETLLGRFIAKWQEERNVCDIPFNTFIIVSSTSCGTSFRTFYNSDFILDTEKYLEGFSLKIIGLETLSFEYPF
jgi:hypothetical protein